MQLLNPTFKKSSTARITTLQQALQMAGYNIDPVELQYAKYGDSTANAISAIQKANSLPVDGIASADTLAAINKTIAGRTASNTYGVSGTVTNSLGEPLSAQGLSVYAIDLVAAGTCYSATSIKAISTVKGYTLLTTGSTNTDGEFEMKFTTALTLPGIIVYATQGDNIQAHSSLSSSKDYGTGKEIQGLKIVNKASTARGVSEYDRMMQAITPALTASGLQLAALSASAEQATFVSQQTGISLQNLTLLSQAAGLSSDTGKINLSQPMLYGIARQKIAMNWATLLVTKAADVSRAVQQSVMQNIIAPVADVDLSKFLTDLHTYAGTAALTPPAKTAPTLLSAIGYATPDAALQRSFISFYQNHVGTPDQFWADLQQQADFKSNKTIIPALQFTNQLTVLTGGHLPLMQELQVGRGMTSASQLLSLSDKDWSAIIQKTGVPDDTAGTTPDEKAANYTGAMKTLLNAAFPTQKIALMLGQNLLKPKDATLQPMAVSFFTQATDFDIASSHVADYSKVIATIAKDKAPALTDHLSSLQRVYHISPSPETMDTLMTAGISSAAQVARIPQKSFVQMYSTRLGGADMAVSVHERAGMQHLQSKKVAARVREAIYDVSVDKIVDRAGRKRLHDAVQKKLPNYTTLFGSPDVCECDDCLSVFSPASYLVDIMQFLDNSVPNAKGKTPLDVLLSRRPDLGQLLLTCENTNTIIPYIDLVNETMEYYVTHLNGGNQLPQPGTFDGLAPDTGTATVPELRAEPQYSSKSAYSTIYQQRVYPFTMPYHQPLDVIRSFLKFIKTSRQELMDVFSNDISARITGSTPTAPMAIPPLAIAAETLSLSLREYEIITTQCSSTGVLSATDFGGQSVTGVKTIGEYYGYNAGASFLPTLINVNEFLQRSGIAYTDLVEILKTQFINPGQNTLNILQALIRNTTISPQTLYTELANNTWKTDAAFLQMLKANSIDVATFTTWLPLGFKQFTEVISLFNSTSACELDTTQLRSLAWIYANNADSTVADPKLTTDLLSRLHRFIRLWLKTGWTIHELDSMLITLQEVNAQGETDITPALISKLSLVKQINDKLNIPLTSLACIWGELDTYGVDSLYAQTFLSSSAKNATNIFEPDPLGQLLTNGNKLAASIPELAGATKITNDELVDILADTGLNTPAAPLNVKTISQIYRYKILADALRISIAQLISVKTVFGLSPFPGQGTTAIDPQLTLTFINTVLNIQDANFDISTLGYVMSNAADAANPGAITPDQILPAIPLIRATLLQIDSDNPASDIATITADMLNKKLVLIFGKDVAGQLIAMLKGTNVSLTPVADNTVLIPAPLNTKYMYVQQGMSTYAIQCTGTMSDTEYTTLSTLPAATPSFKAAIDKIYKLPQTYFYNNFYGIYAVDLILTDSLTTRTWSAGTLIIPDALLAKISYNRSLGQLRYKGIMSSTEHLLLKNKNSGNAAFATLVDSIYLQSKQPLNMALFNLFGLAHVDPDFAAPTGTFDSTIVYSLFYASYLPFLTRQLKEEAIVQGLSSLTGLDPLSVQTLIMPNIDKLIAMVSQTGIDVSYFSDATFTTTADAHIDAAIDNTYLLTPDSALPAASPFSAKWQGWLCPDKTDDYLITIKVGAAANTIALSLNGAKILSQTSSTAAMSFDVTVSLAAGQMYQLELDLVGVTSVPGAIQLLWQTLTVPQAVIGTANLYGAAQVTGLINMFTAYKRGALFVSGFALSNAEIGYLMLHQSYFSDIDFSGLKPVHWQRIYSYSQLRSLVPAAALLGLFHAAIVETESSAGLPPSPSLNKKIAHATGWNLEYLNYLTIGNSVAGIPAYYTVRAADFSNEAGFLKIKKAMDLAAKTGMSISDTGLPGWATIEVDTTTSFDDFYRIAKGVKNGVKAKYADADWQKLSGQRYDIIRENQKQALIAYLTRAGLVLPNGEAVITADTLYEYLLIDVQVAAIMDTSRVIQATMAVQLFISRCLLNLEDRAQVVPGAIDADHWAWMQYYSVEASWKKLCVYVENYLIETLRDDKTPFFKELEASLQKSDINTANVETAFHDYLVKLHQVSNLEVCSMYKDTDKNITHVFARTHAAPYDYYHRTLDSSGYWSAWKPVALDIKSIDDNANSGVHLVPVIWQKRLYLFWPEFLLKHKNPDNSTTKFGTNGTDGMLDKTPAALTPQPYWEVRLAWSEYTNFKWTPRKLSKEVLTTDIQYLDWETFPYEYRFTPSIDADDKLNISLDWTTIWDWEWFSHKNNPEHTSVRIGTFTLVDIHGKLLVDQGETAKFATDSSTYRNFFQAGSKNTSPLVLAGNTYLKASNTHRLLFSNQLTASEVEKKVIYPFFYTDVHHHKTYFVNPVTVSIIVILRNPAKAGYLAFDDSAAALGKTSPTPKFGISNTGTPVRAFTPPALGITSAAKGSLVFAKSNAAHNSDIVKYGGSFGGIIEPIYRLSSKQELEFFTFYHPFVSNFAQKLSEGGISGILAANTAEFREDPAYPYMDRRRSLLANDKGAAFKTNEDPNTNYVLPYPAPDPLLSYYTENVDFDKRGPYAQYNWELFYHAPMLIATQLSKNGKYADAQKWFHYIFNPYSTESADPVYKTSSYWRLLPFKETQEKDIVDFFTNLSADANKDIEDWRKNPFQPFVIARGRPLAFMKNVVMSYLDNLIAWGDDLYRTDTRENINLATQLYVLAAQILGPQPQFVPKRGVVSPMSYNDMRGKLNEFGDIQAALENMFPFTSEIQSQAGSSTIPTDLMGVGGSLYFCVPANDKLLSYWDTVGIRLFNIRHSRNIDGVERSLALFQPPLDPALLVAAAAQGLDIGSVLADMSGPEPMYRFSYLMQKAKEFTGTVVSLGGAILSAGEKKDGEEMARLHASQELTLLNMVTGIKERQILEAMATQEGLLKSRETSLMKLNHYVQELLGNAAATVPDIPQLPDQLTADSTLPSDTIIPALAPGADTALVDSDEAGVKIISKEKQEIDDSQTAYIMQQTAASVSALAGIMALIPSAYIKGHPMGVGVALKWGGENLAPSMKAAAEVIQIVASGFTHSSNNAAKMASYIRREQDWVFQANMVAREIVQLDKQITAGAIRIQTAQKELENHKQQIQNSQDVDDLLHSKFSNQELYQWMKDRLNETHRTCYQMAYDMAKKAEKAYRFELGLQSSNIIQYGYYNDSYIGITAGEQLQMALNQLEQSYIDLNVREFELTKHISIAILDPRALLQLTLTGSCTITLPEEIFDLDYAGHYFRRIRSVAITIPCIAGPYTTINSTLRLLSNNIRANNTLNHGSGDKYQRNTGPNGDARFIQNNTPFTAIATSSGQNDSGVFELNFRDERYLPFEGAGALSTWELGLNGKSVDASGNIIDLSQFDFRSISDVIVHLKYTAREDASQLKPACVNYLNTVYLKDATSPFQRLFSLKRDFPTEFYQLLNTQVTNIEITAGHFNKLFANKAAIDVTNVEIMLWPKAGVALPTPVISLSRIKADGTPDSAPVVSIPTGGASGWLAGMTDSNDGVANASQAMTTSLSVVGKYSLKSSAMLNNLVDDMMILVDFHV